MWHSYDIGEKLHLVGVSYKKRDEKRKKRMKKDEKRRWRGYTKKKTEEKGEKKSTMTSSFGPEFGKPGSRHVAFLRHWREIALGWCIIQEKRLKKKKK
jgi:hypothetical protein